MAFRIAFQRSTSLCAVVELRFHCTTMLCAVKEPRFQPTTMQCVLVEPHLATTTTTKKVCTVLFLFELRRQSRCLLVCNDEFIARLCRYMWLHISRLIMSSSRKICYTINFLKVLSSVIIMDNSGGSDLSADGHVFRKKITNILFSYSISNMYSLKWACSSMHSN